jgi:hypothetical protein
LELVQPVKGIGGPDRLIPEAVEGLMLDTVQRGRRGKARR